MSSYSESYSEPQSLSNITKKISTYLGSLFFIWCYGAPEERLWPRLYGEKLP